MFLNRISLASVSALLCSLPLLLPALTHAQAPATPPSTQPARLSLSVTPAAEPRPALKYSFWLSESDLQPGNGSSHYYRAMLAKRALHLDAAFTAQFPGTTVQAWLRQPLKDLPAKEIETFLERHGSMLEELQQATSRETCDWNLRLKDLRGTNAIEFLLDDFSEMRNMSHVIAVKSRLAVASGKHEEAIQTLRMGYRLAYDTARPPLLINALIGVAIAAQMNSVVMEMIDAPNSPNLYWALKELPHPLINARPALAFEMTIPFRVFPFLKDAETAERSPEEWKRLLDQAIEVVPLITNTGPQREDWRLRFAVTGLLLRAYTPAKKALIESGMPAETVERMPVAQVVAIQTARSNRYAFEELFKWTQLPYSQARTRLLQTEAELMKQGYLGGNGQLTDSLPLAPLLMPALHSAMLATQRSDHQFATLETIEAIRMHAAARGGKLPDSLESLEVVPAPANPFTGRAFDYHLDNQGRGVLEERSPGVDPARARDQVYLIELEKGAK